MKTKVFLLMIASALALTLGVAGCGSKSTNQAASSTATETAGPPATVEAGHEHAHASAGPHGGSLIEPGEEEYHAEMVHDDAAGTVTVYVLDSAAKTAVPIDSAEVTINLKHEGRGEQFKLAAAPEAGDPAGRSSRVVSSDAELTEDLDREEAAPQLVMTINDKQYRGAIEHGHDHGEGHHHTGDDTLVWGRSDIQQAGYLISIGHHSKILHAGEPVEPAVSVTFNGKPVSDAQVYNSLWSGDRTTAIAEEVRTTYEPPTAEEPAHYAQGALKIPSDATNAVIRFRIVLPGNAGEVSYDLPVTMEH